ncbi:MAG: hypothetical protein IPP22_10945 [Nitrosomonas sp.]|nr:hypothetical protein [Nitrosomonas sp.]
MLEIWGWRVMAAEGSSCHFHGSKVATEETVINCATERKERLIKQGKIDPSWKMIEQDKIEMVDGQRMASHIY